MTILSIRGVAMAALMAALAAPAFAAAPLIISSASPRKISVLLRKT